MCTEDGPVGSDLAWRDIYVQEVIQVRQRAALVEFENRGETSAFRSTHLAEGNSATTEPCSNSPSVIPLC